MSQAAKLQRFSRMLLVLAGAMAVMAVVLHLALGNPVVTAAVGVVALVDLTMSLTVGAQARRLRPAEDPAVPSVIEER